MPTVRHLPIASHSARRSPSSVGVTRVSPPNWSSALAPSDADHDGQGSSEQLLQVGDLARASGKTVRAIHHYEEVGLLKPHARSKGRYRLYDQAAVTRVRWIGKLHDLGLSLSQIQ